MNPVQIEFAPEPRTVGPTAPPSDPSPLDYRGPAGLELAAIGRARICESELWIEFERAGTRSAA